MAEKAACFNEESLTDSTVFVHNMLERKDLTFIMFTWTIQNYSQLKKNTFYCKYAVGAKHKHIFKLVKARGTLFLVLSTNAVNKEVSFSLLSRSEVRLHGGGTLEIEKGLYISEFCRKAIKDSKFLKDDVLCVQCRYHTKPLDARGFILPYGQQRDTADVFQLCCDLRELYFTAKFADFTILVQDMCFPVHKMVLIARANFFSRLFEGEGNYLRTNVDIDTDPLIMHEVLLYFYSGELKDLDFDDMIEVFHIAESLQARFLVKKCSDFFASNFTEDNAVEILTVASTYGEVELKNAAMRYMAPRTERVLQKPHWRNMEKLAIIVDV